MSIFKNQVVATKSRRAGLRRATIEAMEGRVLLTSVVVNTIADGIFLPNTGLVSLRMAVGVANLSATPTAISFSPSVFATPQTIVLAGHDLELSNSSVTGNTTISGSAAGVTISGNNKSEVLTIDPSVTAAIVGVTITAGRGAGDIVNAGTLTLTNDTVSGATAGASGYGGSGIDNTGMATLTNCIVSNNNAGESSGGGIENDNGTLVIVNSTISGNSTASGGGGIDNAGMATLTDCTVTNDNANYGGGILNETFGGNATLTMTSCTVSNNTGWNAGGGIDNFAPANFNTPAATATATLTACTLSGNTTPNGSAGGIYNENPAEMNKNTGTATLTMTNDTVYGNAALLNGGGVDSNGTATITNCTISGNGALGTLGGGIVNNAVAANFTVANTIVAANTALTGNDADGAFNSLGNNLVGAPTDPSTGWTANDFTGTATNPLNAKLGALASNGGPTETVLPLTGSPAIDQGSNALIPMGVTTDQRGLLRVYNSTVDIGSVEVQLATPRITWANPADIQFGAPLGPNQLDATAFVPGTFVYSPPAGTILGGGANQTLSVTFTPTDTADYTTATATVKINVTPATPTITWSNPAAITFGTALSATQLDATSSVGGTFVYSPVAGTILGAGNAQKLSVTFTPSVAIDYKSTTASVTIDVAKATPKITWAAPAAITKGTPLSGTQLDATATVGGTFVYSPAAGTILAAGNGQKLSVTFTPTDTTDYNTATASTTINVTSTTSSTGSITGSVFNDLNGDGKQVSGETALSGWVIDLSTGATATTTSAGQYSFSNLAPGKYSITEVVKSGWRRTTPTTSPTSVTVTAGGTVAAPIFGDTQHALISGIVFNDTNGNGKGDAGELGVANWHVTIQIGSGAVLQTAVTSSSGAFSFNIAAGTYVVKIVSQSGYKITTSTSATITVASGATSTPKYFGVEKS